MKRGDRILLVVLAAAMLAAAAWLWLPRLRDGGGAGAVVATQSKQGFYRVDPLDAEVEYTVETAGGGVNTVRIHGGAVEVASANCGNQDCVLHDAVDAPGGQIVCLPHGVVVEVVADEGDAARLQ